MPNPIALEVGNRAAWMGGNWQPVSLRPGTRALHCALRDLEPEKDRTEQVVISQRQIGKGSIVAIHGPAFRDYFHTHFPRHRELIRKLVDQLGIAWDVSLDASPRLELIARRKEGCILPNLVNRGAGETLSTQRMIVVELPPVDNAAIDLRMDAPPAAVTLEPANRPLQWAYDDGLVKIRVPRVEVHDIVVVKPET